MNKLYIFLFLIFSQVSIAQTIDAKLPVDLNKDGLITSSEITAAIDAFFEGDSAFTSAEITAAIDAFFEEDSVFTVEKSNNLNVYSSKKYQTIIKIQQRY